MEVPHNSFVVVADDVGEAEVVAVDVDSLLQLGGRGQRVVGRGRQLCVRDARRRGRHEKHEGGRGNEQPSAPPDHGLATDSFSSLVTFGILGLFFTHVFENVGMTVNLMPITGIPLPFFSYGGSFFIICSLCLGLAFRVAWDSRQSGYPDI